MTYPSPAQTLGGPTTAPRGNPRIVFLLLLLIAGAYYGRIIFASSFVVDDRRYFCLADDAMVSMRYARNAASGDGLVWNPGEPPVEGFSNPAWVALMTLFHFFPIPPPTISLYIQVCGALFLLLNLFVVRRIACRLAPQGRFSEILSVLLTASYFPLLALGLAGMEISLCVLLVDWAVLEAFKAVEDRRFNPLFYMLLALGPWIRLDLLLPLGLIWLFLTWNDPQGRSTHLRAGPLAILGSMGIQTLARLWYFGDWLPNTYYLKLTGFPFMLRLSRGLADLGHFIWTLNPLLVLLPVFLIPRRSWKTALLFSILAGQAAYHVYAGGDIVVSRFLLTAMPLFFILFSLALDQVRGMCSRSPFRPLHAGFWMALPWVFLVFNGVIDADSARRWMGDPEATRASRMVYDNAQHVERSLAVNRIIGAGATVAVTWAGAQGYFIHGNIIDLLGKSDRTVAHLKGRAPKGPERWTAYFPGHVKWDDAYSIGSLRPDLVVETWGDPEEVRPFLEKGYARIRSGGFLFYALKDSPRIGWSNADP